MHSALVEARRGHRISCSQNYRCYKPPRGCWETNQDPLRRSQCSGLLSHHSNSRAIASFEITSCRKVFPHCDHKTSWEQRNLIIIVTFNSINPGRGQIFIYKHHCPGSSRLTFSLFYSSYLFKSH